MENSFTVLGKILESIHPGVTIADGEGNFVFASKLYLESVGVSETDIIGKNCADEEISRIFSPCATKLVLEKGERVTTVQRDLHSAETFVTGIPIFENGTIVMVVCYSSWEVTGYDDLRDRYNMLRHENQKLRSEIDRLVRKDIVSSSLISCGKKSSDTVRLVRIFSEADCPCFLYGPSGSGKSYLAQLVYSNKGAVSVYDCSMLSADTIAKELFGDGESAGKINSNGYRALVIKNAERLTPELQNRLVGFIKHSRLILVGISEFSLETLLEKKIITDEFYHFFSAYQAEVFPLKERPEDLKNFIEYYLDTFNRRYSRKVRFTPRALSCLLSFNWKENIDEVKSVVERIVLTAEKETVDVYNLPQRFSSSSSDIYSENATLKEMLEFYESGIINRTYESFPTTVSLAKKLGISQASAVRKIQKYVNNGKSRK